MLKTKGVDSTEKKENIYALRCGDQWLSNMCMCIKYTMYVCVYVVMYVCLIFKFGVDQIMFLLGYVWKKMCQCISESMGIWVCPFRIPIENPMQRRNMRTV